MGYVCIHGHFYQPPRENPWLEAIELQDSAYPYHDWNERITAECYQPNAAARIMDGGGRILKILSNYPKMSFDFGPTLLSWMEARAPKVYQAILDADKASQEHFPGHGSAVAQAYNHMIMPLANRRDKVTQVAWGIKDFEHRFGRKPEGMWLPETAVDIECLEILAENNIRFTVLAPRQAKRESKIGSRQWKDVSGERIDPSMAYLCRLPSGKSIVLFFYDGPISKAIAFEHLLASGDQFVDRLMSGFAEDVRSWPELVHIAVDGETFGHHHKMGEMTLAFALDKIDTKELAQVTNYAEFLELHPPIHRVEIFENTSWSCVHGVERWRSNCGCNSGGYAGWNQEWRAPLRAALDWLRDALAPLYEEKGKQLLKDPWAARNGYIDVVLNRSSENIDRFFHDHAARELSPDDRVTALKLLEMQRNAMLMYTSCGWFFDELSGIETVQCIQYAGRVVDLAKQLFKDNVETRFPRKVGASQEQPAGIRRRRADLSEVRRAGGHRPSEGGRSLRHCFHLRALSRIEPHLLLRRRSRGLRRPRTGKDQAGHRARAGLLDRHPGDRDAQFSGAASRKSGSEGCRSRSLRGRRLPGDRERARRGLPQYHGAGNGPAF